MVNSSVERDLKVKYFLDHIFAPFMVLSAPCAQCCLSVTNNFISHLMSHVSVATGFYLTASFSLSLISNYGLRRFLSELSTISVEGECVWQLSWDLCLVLWLTLAGVRAREKSGERSVLCCCSAAWRRLAFTASEPEILKTTTCHGSWAELGYSCMSELSVNTKNKSTFAPRQAWKFA